MNECEVLQFLISVRCDHCDYSQSAPKNPSHIRPTVRYSKRCPDWFWVPVDNLLADLFPLVNRIERETRCLPSDTQAKIRALYLHSLKILHTVLIGGRDKPSGTFQIRIQVINPIISEPWIFQRLTYKNLHTKICITFAEQQVLKYSRVLENSFASCDYEARFLWRVGRQCWRMGCWG